MRYSISVCVLRLTAASGAVNGLIKSRAAIDSNLLEMKKGRKGFIGESHLHNYLLFNADTSSTQTKLLISCKGRSSRPLAHRQVPDLVVNIQSDNENPLHMPLLGDQWHNITVVVLGETVSGDGWKCHCHLSILCVTLFLVVMDRQSRL